MSTRTGQIVDIDWVVPGSRLDAAFGDGATRAEKALPNITAIAGVALLFWYAASTPELHWQWWRYLIAAVFVYDLVGGVVANGLNSAKRFQHARRIAVPRPTASFVRNHVLFAAVHVQPILVAILFPGPGVWWGAVWYAIALVTVVMVLRVPLYLRRPAALMVIATAPMLAAILPAPLGFSWLPAVLVAKLGLGAVQEEPYRPVPHRHRPSNLCHTKDSIGRRKDDRSSTVHDRIEIEAPQREFTDVDDEQPRQVRGAARPSPRVHTPGVNVEVVGRDDIPQDDPRPTTLTRPTPLPVGLNGPSRRQPTTS